MSDTRLWTSQHCLSTQALPVQKKLDLLKEPLGCGLMLQKKVVLALKWNESGTWNAGSHCASCLERHSCISSCMHNERRRSHLAEEVIYINISAGFIIARRALG